MKVICKKTELISALNISIKAVSLKSTLDILECVLLSVSETGFKMTTNNNEIGIETAEIPANVEEPGEAAVEAKIFSEVIKNLPEEDVTLECSQNSIMTIRSGKSKFKLSTRRAEDFPRLAEIERNKSISVSGIVLKSLIKQTIFNVSTDESKPALTGELFEIRNGKLNVVAMDNFRVSFRSIDMQSQDMSVIIPAKALSELSKILSDNDDDSVNIYITENMLLFEMSSCILISRLINENFIKYENFFTKDYKTKIEVNRTGFIRAIERVSLLLKDNRTPININIRENSNVILTAKTDNNDAYDEIEADTEGENLSIYFNSKYLIESLKAIEDERVVIQFLTNLSPCIIKSAKGSESYQYLILPLKP